MIVKTYGGSPVIRRNSICQNYRPNTPRSRAKSPTTEGQSDDGGGADTAHVAPAAANAAHPSCPRGGPPHVTSTSAGNASAATSHTFSATFFSTASWWIEGAVPPSHTRIPLATSWSHTH